MENTPLGQPVSTFEVNDNDEQIFKLNNIIETLLKDGIRPNQIIILTNNVDDSSSLKGIKTFANRKLISTYDREYGRDENCIAHTTINIFKGLESDVIFILDAQNIQEKNNLYTQASRAKHLLYIFSKNI
jgi:DNA helicase IV